jgi:hypothetical protein
VGGGSLVDGPSPLGIGGGPHRDALAAIGSRPPAASRQAPPAASCHPKSSISPFLKKKK